MPLSNPSNSAVFNPLAICLFYLAQTTQQGCEKGRAPRHVVELDVLVQRMRAVAPWAESI
jgi:hypothetical protein